jgi:hypothetical protein
MRGRSYRSGSRTLACLSIIGAAGIGGLAAGFAGRPALPPAPAFVIAEISATETVNLRFPAEWDEPAPAAAPTMVAFASATSGGFSLFSPIPLGIIAEARAEQAEAEVKPAPVPAPAPKVAAVGAAKVQLAAAANKPAAAPRRSNTVLSDSQIASIKRRLNLTPHQERYWPAVEAELRKMEYKRDGKPAQGSRMAQVDLSKVDIDGLKSAGFPLVMSFSEDQRRELKSLAHLLGLENVMTGL